MFVFFHVITGTAISEGLVIILFLNFSPSDEAPWREPRAPYLNLKEDGRKVLLDICYR